MTEVPEIIAPRPDTVELLCGLYRPDTGDYETTATIRELNGFDEEALAKTSSTGAALQMVLERAVVSIGETKVSRSVLDELPMADRVVLLLAIRFITFGDIDLEDMPCGKCGWRGAVSVAQGDIPMRKPESRTFEVQTKKGSARVAFPSGEFHRKALAASGNSVADMVTDLIADCVSDVGDDDTLVGKSMARALAMPDRKRIVDEINKRLPGPQLEEVKKPCPSCGEDLDLSLSLAALFPL